MSETPQPPRAVWRRVAPAKAPRPSDGTLDFFSADLEKLPRCGEPGVSDAEFTASLADEETAAAARAEAFWAEQERRRRDEEERAKREKKRQAEEDDDVKVAERYRNDRYAVKLLRQERTVWGGDGADAGTIG